MVNCNYECVSAVRTGDQVQATVRVTKDGAFVERSFTTHADNDLKVMCEHVCSTIEGEIDAPPLVNAPVVETIDVSKITLDPVAAKAAAESAG